MSTDLVPVVPPERSGRTIEASDIRQVRWLSSVAVSPDGSSVAFIESYLGPSSGRMTADLVVVAVDRPEAALVTVPSVATWGARWDHAGERLAFAADRDGALNLWLWESASGRPQPLLSDESPAHPVGPPSWSPDDEYLAIPTGDDVCLLQISTGYTTNLDSPAGRIRSCHWSPDATTVAVVCDTSDAVVPHSIWLLATAEPAARPLVAAVGQVHGIVWSPQGEEIAYVSTRAATDHAPNRELNVVNVATGTIRRVGDELDVSFGLAVQSDDPRGYGECDLRWPQGDRGILCGFPNGGEGRLAWIATAGMVDVDTESACIVSGPEVVLSFDSSSDGVTVAYVSSDPRTPGELYAVRDGRRRRLSARNDGWLAEVRLATVGIVEVPREDGSIVEAWLYSPPDPTKQSATIVAIHGGPHWPTGWRFSFEYQRHAALGRGVVVANPRGSQGYGRAYSTAVQGDWGGADAADVMAVVDRLERRAEPEPRPLVVTGVSYGGYLACLLATRSDRFGVVIAENPLTDLGTYVETSDGGELFAEVELGGTPTQRRAWYEERSPLRRASRVRAPVLLVHAELDQDCPISESRQLHRALELLGRTTSLHEVPGEGHSMVLDATLAHRLDRWAAIDAFLALHLIGATTY